MAPDRVGVGGATDAGGDAARGVRFLRDLRSLVAGSAERALVAGLPTVSATAWRIPIVDGRFVDVDAAARIEASDESGCREGEGRVSRLSGAVKSVIDPRTYLHAFKLLHFASYSHVQQLRRLNCGPDVTFAPNVSFRNAERITIGAGSHLGEHSVIWAGNERAASRSGRNACWRRTRP